MKLVIRSVGLFGHSNIRTWQPVDSSVLAEELFIDVGPRDQEGADTFFLRLATPAGLETLEDREGILATRPLLVMRQYDFDDFWRWLERTVASCEADTWLASVEKLQQYFRWEYGEYKEC